MIGRNLTPTDILELHNSEIKALVRELVSLAIEARRIAYDSRTLCLMYHISSDEYEWHASNRYAFNCEYHAYLKAAKLAANRILKIELL